MGMTPDTYEDGSVAFFSNQRAAWHNTGTVTDRAQTAEEALALIKATTPVTLNPCFTLVNGVFVEVPEFFVTGRMNPVSNVFQPYRPVGKKYTVIQDPAVFAVCDDIIGMSGAHYETAGLMKKGAVVFLSMLLPDTMVFADGLETIKLYLVAINSHDGSRAFQIVVTPVRPVCDNTVTLALQSAVSSFSIRHTASSTVRIAEARHALDLSFAYIGTFQAEVEKLLNHSYSQAKFNALAEQLIPPAPIDARNFVLARQEQECALLKSMWDLPTQDPIRNTAWGAYNSVVEYVDFHSPVKAVGAAKVPARAERTLLGGGARLKDRAYQLISA